MKKIFLITTSIILASFSWYALSGFVKHSSTEDMLRKRIAELEKQVADYEQSASCNYKYFDSETDLRKFIADNYNAGFNYTTVAVNSTNLKNSLNNFPLNSVVYISIVYTPKGRSVRLSSTTTICDPLAISTICCPPNCNPPQPKSIAYPESYNPYAY